jgi:hypothetical protein
MNGRFYLCASRFGFSTDMNGDGIVTITDLWWMFKYVFFGPGDLLVCALYPTRAGQFFEISVDSLYGWGSGVISLIVWSFALISVATYKA